LGDRRHIGGDAGESHYVRGIDFRPGPFPVICADGSPNIAQAVPFLLQLHHDAFETLIEAIPKLVSKERRVIFYKLQVVLKDAVAFIQPIDWGQSANFPCFVSFGDQTFEAIEKGRLDLMLNADDGYLPPRFASEMIFDDSYSCVAAKESKYPRALTLKQYLAAEHVGVGIWDELQTLPDKRLAGIGAKRRCPIWVPYFTAAVRCVPGTHLLATVPTRTPSCIRVFPSALATSK